MRNAYVQVVTQHTLKATDEDRSIVEPVKSVFHIE